MIFKENKEQNNKFSTKKNLFFVSINSYKEVYIEREFSIYYIIQITNNNSKMSWEIEKKN